MTFTHTSHSDWLVIVVIMFLRASTFLSSFLLLKLLRGLQQTIPTSANDIMFHPGPFESTLVGLSAGCHKNNFKDFHKTCMDDGSQPRIDLMKFWCRSR